MYKRQEDIYIGHNYIEDVAQGGIDLCDARNAVVEYNVVAVSYTHLDVYKRQLRDGGIPFEISLNQPNKETIAAML